MSHSLQNDSHAFRGSWRPLSDGDNSARARPIKTRLQYSCPHQTAIVSSLTRQCINSKDRVITPHPVLLLQQSQTRCCGTHPTSFDIVSLCTRRSSLLGIQKGLHAVAVSGKTPSGLLGQKLLTHREMNKKRYFHSL